MRRIVNVAPTDVSDAFFESLVVARRAHPAAERCAREASLTVATGPEPSGNRTTEECGR